MHKRLPVWYQSFSVRVLGAGGAWVWAEGGPFGHTTGHSRTLRAEPLTVSVV